jgi:hypothetical protein
MTTLTLLAQIQHATKNLSALQARVKEQQVLIKELEDLRAECEHDWDAPFPGYEHEGRLCKKCGINDYFAPLHKKQVEAAKLRASN